MESGPPGKARPQDPMVDGATRSDARLARPTRVAEQHWAEDTLPVVIVICLTYNHESFIRECIKGFLIQETRFKVEFIVHDDASTDSTAAIVREYVTAHPGLIRGIFQEVNQYSQRKSVSAICFEKSQGKYIAACEGDDYWIAPHKLQKQVELLEARPEVVMCGCRAFVLREGYSTPYTIEPSIPPDVAAKWGPKELLRTQWYFKTLTRMYPRHVFAGYIRDCAVHGYSYDWTRVLYCLSLTQMDPAKLGFIDEVMATYREHSGGVFFGRKSESKLAWGNIRMLLFMMKFFEDRKALEVLDGFLHSNSMILANDRALPRPERLEAAWRCARLRWGSWRSWARLVRTLFK